MSESAAERAARMKALAEKAAYFTSNPWILYHEPFQVTDNIYFVGNTYVSTYLIDTGDGLILIDRPSKKVSILFLTEFENWDFIRKISNIFFFPMAILIMWLLPDFFRNTRKQRCGSAKTMHSSLPNVPISSVERSRRLRSTNIMIIPNRLKWEM